MTRSANSGDFVTQDYFLGEGTEVLIVSAKGQVLPNGRLIFKLNPGINVGMYVSHCADFSFLSLLFSQTQSPYALHGNSRNKTFTSTPWKSQRDSGALLISRMFVIT